MIDFTIKQILFTHQIQSTLFFSNKQNVMNPFSEISELKVSNIIDPFSWVKNNINLLMKSSLITAMSDDQLKATFINVPRFTMVSLFKWQFKNVYIVFVNEHLQLASTALTFGRISSLVPLFTQAQQKKCSSLEELQ